MKPRAPITCLRISYWVGAIFDGLVVIPMLSPQIGGFVFGIPDFKTGPDYRYAMSLAASLMIGWVFLLIWADCSPLERKGVLLMTIFPVLMGLVISGFLAVSSNLVPGDKMLSTFIMQAILLLLFGFSYWNARLMSAA